jgi:hypothetical protein
MKPIAARFDGFREEELNFRSDSIGTEEAPDWKFQFRRAIDRLLFRAAFCGRSSRSGTAPGRDHHL